MIFQQPGFISRTFRSQFRIAENKPIGLFHLLFITQRIYQLGSNGLHRRIIIPNQHFQVLHHKYLFPVTAFILRFQRTISFLFIETLFYTFDDLVHTIRTDYFMKQPAFCIQHQKSRISPYLKPFPQFRPLSFFHIILYTDKLRIEIISGFFLRKHILSHILTRPTPGSITIHKHVLLLTLRLVQRFPKTQVFKIHPILRKANQAYP